ncbi:MAG: hypothetical protein HY704_03400 [Gemmatimonadetes bacterium]|nr:hypothetical protein [Gemmatimonadota bacterium]
MAFGPLHGRKTDILFLVLARDERSHLVLLAKIERLVRCSVYRESR